MPIIENASLEENDELQDLWANLLVSALDPKFDGKLRTAFIDILKQLEVIDVHILNFVYSRFVRIKGENKEKWANHPDLKDYDQKSIDISIWKGEIIKELNINEDLYMNSVDNLIRLRCFTSYVEDDDVPTEDNWHSVTIFHSYDEICMTPFGVSFVESCMNSDK